jgi:hypothetical protein
VCDLAARAAAANRAKMANVRKLGRDGERLAKVKKNHERIDSLSRPGKYRIPDGMTRKTLTEVKNVAKQHFSRQLQDSLHHAMMTGRQMILITRKGTVLTAPLKAAIASGKIFHAPIL